jgi:hypothetical protein
MIQAEKLMTLVTVVKLGVITYDVISQSIDIKVNTS